MARQIINTKQFVNDTIQIIRASNVSASLTGANVAFDTTDLTIGTRLTRSGATVVIGSGVSYVKVSYTVMVESGSTAPYLYTRIRKNSSDLSQAIDASTSQFKSTSETKIIPVTANDTISIYHDIGGSGSATIRGSTSNGAFMTVEVIV